MATRKYLVVVEEGQTGCSECPIAKIADCYINQESLQICDKFDLATMRIKEYNVPDCYDMQCKARIPEFKIELEDKIELEEEK
jgi:hypothetical protein